MIVHGHKLLMLQHPIEEELPSLTVGANFTE
jgi:hypothetical protein